MAVIRCSRGHYYDDQKFFGCPHCGILVTGPEPKEKKKRGFFGRRDAHKDRMPESGGDQNGQDHGQQIAAGWETDVERTVEGLDPRTIGFSSGTGVKDWVTGWLVCVEGPEKGRDYRLHYGFNRIGRSYSMDVQVIDDYAITSEEHCSVVYDDRHNRFLIIPSSETLTYCNGQLLTAPAGLEAGDQISLGNSRFEFIPFCRKGKVWEKQNGE